MNDIILYEIKYENICENGIICIYNSFNYQIKEFKFDVKKNKKQINVEIQELYSYFLEDSHYYFISKYLKNKYKLYDNILCIYSFNDIDITEKNTELYKIIKEAIKINYETDLDSFSK